MTQQKAWPALYLGLFFMLIGAFLSGWNLSMFSLFNPFSIMFCALSASGAFLSGKSLQHLQSRAPTLSYLVWIGVAAGCVIIGTLLTQKPPTYHADIAYIQNFGLLVLFLMMLLVGYIGIIERFMLGYDGDRAKTEEKTNTYNIWLHMVVAAVFAGSFSLIGWSNSMGHRQNSTHVWGWHQKRNDIIQAYTRDRSEHQLFINLKQLEYSKEQFKHLYFFEQIFPKSAFLEEREWCMLQAKAHRNTQESCQDKSLFVLKKREDYHSYRPTPPRPTG